MQEVFGLIFFMGFFYWPIYLLGAVIALFLVYKFWGKKPILIKLLLSIFALFGALILAIGLYVVVMLIYGAIINF